MRDCTTCSVSSTLRLAGPIKNPVQMLHLTGRLKYTLEPGLKVTQLFSSERERERERGANVMH